MDSDPEGDGSREAIRNNRFPSLQDQHPSFKVKGGLVEDGLQVTFRFKGELKEIRTKISTRKLSSDGPML